MKLVNKQLIATILKYCAPSSITLASFDNTDIIGLTKKKAAPPKIIEATKPIDISNPSTFLILLTSFFPQYCDINTLAPAFIPERHRVNIKKYWLASPTDAIASSPNLPIIKLSTRFSDDVTRF